MDALFGWLLLITIGWLVYRFRRKECETRRREHILAQTNAAYERLRSGEEATTQGGINMSKTTIGHRYSYEGELFITKDGMLGVTDPNTLDDLPLADQLKRVLYQRLDPNGTVTFDKVRITIERIEER